MRRIQLKTLTALSVILLSYPVQASDKSIVVDNDKTVDMAISIYNNNLAFVKDTREVKLDKGYNRTAFVGVASQIRPETAMLFGNGIKVIEQNYDYNLLTPQNILAESVGKMVKTALYNEKTGETVFDTAKIIESNYGAPILQFSYGIETNFPGRIIYESLPQNLRAKPTLVVDLENDKQASKKLELAYLTNGVSWKADYIADITADDTLSINGWITLKNESGVDYKDARVQVIAGNINQVSTVSAMPRMMKAMGRMAMNVNYDAVETASVSQESFADYYLYNLPVRTSINNNQSKQVSLITKENVKFEREYKLVSPLYLGLGVGESDFEKQNPDVVFKIENKAASNLGIPMPQGIMRFYENDSKGSLLFAGESNVQQTAVGEQMKLTTGRSFDIFAKGKVANVKSIAKDLTEAETEITFNNAKSEAVTVVFEQNFGGGWEIVSESIKGVKKSAHAMEWKVNIPAKGKTVLTYKVRLMKK